MRDDNQAVMERGWESFMRVAKYCIKGGVYTLLNMILVNREHPTLNGVDYHNVVRKDCNRLPCFTGQAVLPAFTLNNCRTSKQNTKGISLKCVAPFGVLPSVYPCDVETVFSRLGYFCSKDPKCSLLPSQKSPYSSIYWPISVHSTFFLLSVLVIFCHRYMRLSSRFSRLKFLIQIYYVFLVPRLHHPSPIFSSFCDNTNIISRTVQITVHSFLMPLSCLLDPNQVSCSDKWQNLNSFLNYTSSCRLT